MPNLPAAPVWLEVTVQSLENEIHVSVRGGGGEVLLAQPLGISQEVLAEFAAAVERAATHGMPLDESIMKQGQRIQRALAGGDAGRLFAQANTAAGESLLIRFLINDPALQVIPWEALYDKDAIGFWGTSANVLPARAISSTRPSKPREVRNTLNVLTIAPGGDAGVVNLRTALDESIQAGQVEWLEPLVGRQARVDAILHRLRRDPKPHVIHFIGHGRVHEGIPALELAGDTEGEMIWIWTQTIAQELSESIHQQIRLIVLECCEGARPSAFASSGEVLTSAGVDAVIAYAWPIRASDARVCSTSFYRDLTRADGPAGDVAKAMNAARRAIHANCDASAAAMSPVLFLRRNESRIFDFSQRRPDKVAPLPPSAPAVGNVQIPSGLSRIVRGDFSLILGDRWKECEPQHQGLRQVLRDELGLASRGLPEGLPIEILAQWHALRHGKSQLDELFQQVFQEDLPAPPVVRAMARLLRPGVHVTLLHTPWLETSLAEQQPQRTINVIQRGGDGILFMRRDAGAQEWKRLKVVSKNMDLDNEFLILRPYGGYTLEQNFHHPLLTEDDYCAALHGLFEQKILPMDINHMIMRILDWRPALICGMSAYTANHRMLLHALHCREIPRNSLAIINVDAVHDGAAEQDVWQSGRGLPHRADEVEVVAMTSDALLAALRAIVIGGP